MTKAALTCAVLASLLLLQPVVAAPPQDQLQRTTQLWTEGIIDVSGLAALTAFSNVPYDDQDLDSICAMKQTVVRNAFQATGDYLAHLESAPPAQRDHQSIMKLHHQLAQLHGYQGDMVRAIERFEAAYRIAAEQKLAYFQQSLEEKLGIAQMRRGEVENCVESHNARSCIFPLSAEALHQRPSGSEAAIKHFLKFLATAPDNLEVRWLLNVAHMTLGSYPAKVPSAYLLPPSVFQSKAEVGTLNDVAPSLGLDASNMAGGAILEDFDGDGYLDAVISSQDSCAPLRFFRSNGDGTFEDATAEAKLADQLGGLNLVQTDYDNDGRPDIFVLRGGWEFPMRNSLLRSNKDGTFTDVTSESGLAAPATATQTAAWADFDLDGYLDVFVGNEFSPSQLFRNRGDGTFVDVAPAAGVDRTAFTKAAVWADYDNDRYPDLYVSNYAEKNFFYRNNGDGTFTEAARMLGVENPVYSFPAWFMDYDNDGRLDLFVSGYVQSLADVVRGYLGRPLKGETFKVYRNMGKSGFEDVTGVLGMARNILTMGCNFGDLDNDGYLDFYVGTGAPSYGALMPNLLFRNEAGKAFSDVTSSSRTGHLQKGHGIAFGDLDSDGDQDIFLHTGGAVPGDAYQNAVFRNPGHGNHWIAIQLQGEKTNRAAVGVRIKLVLPGAREVHREVTSGGSFGASSFEQHVGAGNADRIAALEIWWPASNTRQTFENITTNQVLAIKEFSENYDVIERQSFHLTEKDAPHKH